LPIVAKPLVGGLNFLIATLLLVYTSYEARYGEPGRADRRRVARKHPFLGAEGWTLRAAVGEVGLALFTSLFCSQNTLNFDHGSQYSPCDQSDTRE
jgi:hypothetical protein